MTDGQSASLSWSKAPIWHLRPDFYYCQTVAGLSTWSAPSDERTGLSFTIPAGPRQCSLFRVRVPLDLWPYFNVSDSRLPLSSPPATRRVTVEVFDLASKRDFLSLNSKIVPIVTTRYEPRRNTISHCVIRSLPWEYICEAVTQQRLQYICLFRDSCLVVGVVSSHYLATGLYATILKLILHK
jgi:hypothetical protein